MARFIRKTVRSLIKRGHPLVLALTVTSGVLAGAGSLGVRPAHADGGCGFWFTLARDETDTIHLDEMPMCNSSVVWLRAALNCPGGGCKAAVFGWDGNNWRVAGSDYGGNSGGQWLLSPALQAPCHNWPARAEGASVTTITTPYVAPC